MSPDRLYHVTKSQDCKLYFRHIDSPAFISYAAKHRTLYPPVRYTAHNAHSTLPLLLLLTQNLQPLDSPDTDRLHPLLRQHLRQPQL